MSGGMETTAKLFDFCQLCKKAAHIRDGLCLECRNRLEIAYDSINHPKHYKSHPSGIECIEITRHMTFNLGNAIKYIWRAGEKDDKIEDLKKAAWYLSDEIARLTNGEPK